MNNQKKGINNLIEHRQIVQRYPLQSFSSQPYPPHYHTQSPYFIQDQVFQELESIAIVEDYKPGKQFTNSPQFMEIEDPDLRMEEQEPYEQLMLQEKPPFPTNSAKLLDSDSSGRQLPERKSSVSSLQSQTEKEMFSPLLMRPQVGALKIQSFVKANRMNHPDERKAKARRQIGSSTQKRERMVKIKKLQEVGCNCKKTKCLKLYCQCFNLQILCGQNCNCINCGNMSQSENHQKAVLDALTRNPKAFAQDAQEMTTVFQLGVDLSQVKKGCKCRKTQCRKKYCECFNSGTPCGIFCQCEGCHNKPSPR